MLMTVSYQLAMATAVHTASTPKDKHGNSGAYRFNHNRDVTCTHPNMYAYTYATQHVLHRMRVGFRV
jgi:hypothetical protein